MKRLFSVSILCLLLVISCQTKATGEAFSAPSDSEGWMELAENEDTIENRYNMLYSLYREGVYSTVIEKADEALAVYPEYTRLLKIKASALKKEGNEESYLSVLGEILEREPYDESLRDLYTDELLNAGENEKALGFSRETILIYPENKKALEVLSSSSAFYSYLKDTLQSQV